MPNDDLLELFRRHQATRSVEGLSHLLIFRRRRAPDFARRRLDVLFFDGVNNVGRNQAQLGHHVGLEPHAHAVIGAAEQIDLGDSGDAEDLIAQIYATVID